MIASICDEMFQCGQEKSTEPPFLPIGVRMTPVLDQVGEKALRQILRILVSVTFLAQENVEWAPINLAQFRERTECLSGRRRVARCKDNRPTGGDKQFTAIFRFPTHDVNQNNTNGALVARRKDAERLRGVGNSSGDENGSDPMKYWEIIADNLSKAGS
jgi:hypothetical protein